ncbi:polymorphic toxin type 50 domain-containing protein [Lactococcus insecticola]|uniref:Bacterial toxin 50 domain-containing protein n=1 Tax=Pseudolactococcus insecticola TaxID=2709158 RepID=A0A6A0B3C2_9LACT|nr:polymorphic toxin type 50 domain-containing protein [Lactococcus insecticola]GFH39839.1 hypothetical protein Hs20B_02370 [Lactococcus insecticola]
MAMDETTKKQLALLAVALTFNDNLDTKLVTLMALLAFYGQESKSDKTIRNSLKTLTGAKSDSPSDVSDGIVNYIVPPNKWYPFEKRDAFAMKMKSALATGEIVTDTSQATKIAKQMSSSVKLFNRMNVFATANADVLREAENGDYYEDVEQEDRKGLVIWRARGQADAECAKYNRKIMTVDEFKSIYPVHYNCYCTAELVPPTMSDERIKKYRFKDNRAESEKQPNTVESLQEKGDREQYERWQNEGVTLPSFEHFQNLKHEPNNQAFERLSQEFKQKKWYNNTIGYEDLSDELKKKVNINPDMNNRHIVGTQQWKDKVVNYQKDLIEEGYDGKALPSKLMISNEQSQKIVEQMRLPKGFNSSMPVIFKADDYIAIFIDPETGEEIKTKFVRVSFRKTGSHLTPLDPREE